MDMNFENRFWLEIFSDHLDFFEEKLAPVEVDTISRVQQLKNQVAGIRNNLRTENVLQLALSLRDLKQELLHKRLTNTVKLGLSPTFINHMLNEVEEYIIMTEGLADTSPVHLHLVWLSDASGHAHAVGTELDGVEKMDIKLLFKEEKGFKALHTKALEFAGYLRTSNLDAGTPQLKALNDDVFKLMEAFIKHLYELGVARRSGAKLGIISPQMLNHMIREELYYLRKLGYNVRDPLSPELLQK